MAARFRVPMRTLAELTRLAYFEILSRDGLSQVEIGRRLGQTDRHMRSLSQRLRGEFFVAEQELGLLREIENVIAQKTPSRKELTAAFIGQPEAAVSLALDELLEEGRVILGKDGKLRTAARYVLLRSDQFHRRIDALNHFLDGAFRALMHRLVFDEKKNAMIKMITFTASPDALEAYVARLEGELRRQIAALDEDATLASSDQPRFMLGLTLAPVQEAQPGDK